MVLGIHRYENKQPRITYRLGRVARLFKDEILPCGCRLEMGILCQYVDAHAYGIGWNAAAVGRILASG